MHSDGARKGPGRWSRYDRSGNGNKGISRLEPKGESSFVAETTLILWQRRRSFCGRDDAHLWQTPINLLQDGIRASGVWVDESQRVRKGMLSCCCAL